MLLIDHRSGISAEKINGSMVVVKVADMVVVLVVGNDSAGRLADASALAPPMVITKPWRRDYLLN